MSGAVASDGSFRRLVLPGLAFKAVVIGGGYATGREIAEFFVGSGPMGGLLGLLLAMELGFTAVVAIAAVLYLLAAWSFGHD